MAALRDTSECGPFSDVQTLLASGSVVLGSGLDAAGVKAEAEAGLREIFGYDVSVVVLPAWPNWWRPALPARLCHVGLLDPRLGCGCARRTVLRRTRPWTAWSPSGPAGSRRRLVLAGGTLQAPFSRLTPPKDKMANTRNLRTMIKARDAQPPCGQIGQREGPPDRPPGGDRYATATPESPPITPSRGDMSLLLLAPAPRPGEQAHS